MVGKKNSADNPDFQKRRLQDLTDPIASKWSFAELSAQGLSANLEYHNPKGIPPELAKEYGL